MADAWCIRGREIDDNELSLIRGLVGAHPGWSRRRLSQKLAEHWDWRTPTGQLKDIAVRDILNRLANQGLIALPARQRRGGRQRVRAAAVDGQQGLSLESAPASASRPLAELLPLSWHRAQSGQSERALIARYLSEHHYLGYPDPLGQIHYLIRDRAGDPIACLLFGPAAWKVEARDRWIGWSENQRRAGLAHLANNSRFLILPWVQTRHLASHLLAQGMRHLRADWPTQHGRDLWLVESFVQTERFEGTCYRAANWLNVGQTRGRTRNDRWHRRRVPVKEVYLWPVVADFRQRCCGL